VNKIALGIQKITKRLWRLSEDVAVVFISLCVFLRVFTAGSTMSAVNGPSPGATIVKVGWLQKRGRVDLLFLNLMARQKKDTSFVEMASFQFLMPGWFGCLVSFGSQPRSHYFSVSNIALWCT